jgi:hypothetical protein
MRFQELISILQAAIGPVILISGAGLLLLSMTNRFGRVIDRSRLLIEAIHRAPEEEHPLLLAQVKIFARRARLLRSAIGLATLSLLIVAILVIVLFVAALLQVELAALGAALFIACMLALIGSLVLFLQDIQLSLVALKLELGALPDGVVPKKR